MILKQPPMYVNSSYSIKGARLFSKSNGSLHRGRIRESMGDVLESAGLISNFYCTYVWVLFEALIMPGGELSGPEQSAKSVSKSSNLAGAWEILGACIRDTLGVPRLAFPDFAVLQLTLIKLTSLVWSNSLVGASMPQLINLQPAHTTHIDRSYQGGPLPPRISYGALGTIVKNCDYILI